MPAPTIYHLTVTDHCDRAERHAAAAIAAARAARTAARPAPAMRAEAQRQINAANNCYYFASEAVADASEVEARARRDRNASPDDLAACAAAIDRAESRLEEIDAAIAAAATAIAIAATIAAA